MANFSKTLRNRLTLKALKYATNGGINIYENHSDAIIFENVEDNFLPVSYKGITKNPKWLSRTLKDHSQVRGQKEMQSSNSSDALLMNIFCHPKIGSWKGVMDLLKIKSLDQIEFGHNPGLLVDGVPEKSPTEVDLLINTEIICEAKLTEKDFTKKAKGLVDKYESFRTIFEMRSLDQNDDEYFNYQLIRNLIAAVKYNKRFILFCDMHRPDLIKAFHQTVRCLRDIKNRERCDFITWQEIAQKTGNDLRVFLNNKYGIE